jgi:peptide/nickel transport system ATP-binding protein
VSSPLLVVRDLEAGFRTRAGRVRAVDGVSFDLAAGESFGVVGESGSGKSALSLSLMGLMPANGSVTAGSVRFADADILALPERRRRALRGRRMALVFQDPMTSLNPYQRVGDQVDEQIRLHLGLDRRAARRRTVGLFASVGIPEPEARAARYPHQLSGGQRQRVLIAMALSCDPELLIADEPTTALDVTVQAQVLALLRQQQRSRRMGLILITHNLGVVAATCDRAAVMYAGRFVEVAPVRELFAEPRHPYTRGLFAALPRIDDDRSVPLVAIPGQPPRLVGPRVGCAFAARCPHVEDGCRAVDPALAADATGRLHRCLKNLPPWGGGRA